MSNTAKIVHIKTWNEFLHLANNLKPASIAYTIQRAPLCKPPIGLRLIFASKNTQYVFLDFAKGDALRRTKIPVQRNKAGEAFIDEETIRNFLHDQLRRKDLNVYSLEVLGY
ncbi:MAG: hypothetical protein ACQXXH_04235 [Candidatus Bathyarchaeia archaeon]|nr:hypothetical protein [Candidatus Bathyarchaeota archaeon A05DMB-4]MDH7594947.1 hypothetical protein [Candidatus Bathyarchaeota archaeon]